MRKSRKLLSLLLCFAIVFTMMPTTAFAAGGTTNVTFDVSSTDVNIGDEITVTISYNDMTVSSFTTAVDFDKSLLECMSIVGPNPSRPTLFYITSDPMDPWASYQATAVSSVSEANTKGTVGIAFAGTVDTAYVANPVMTITFKALGEGDAVFTFTEDTAGTDLFRGQVGTSNVTIQPLPEMTGSVSIIGSEAPAFGDTLEVALSEDFAYDGELSYQWKRGDAAIAEATGTSYTLVQEDIGSVITVEVTSTGNSGSKTASTEKVEKAANTSLPEEPTFEKTADTITYTVIEGQEVSLDNVKWENDGTFDGLTPGKKYRIYSRIAETGTHKASGADVYLVQTLKLAQTISTPQGSAVNEKIGKTINLNKYFSSNAAGAQLTFTVNGETDADGMLEVGNIVGTEYTVTASSGELEQYYAAADATVTITTIAKDASAFAEGFAGTVEKLATDAAFTKTATATAGDGAVTYSSSNPAVATVNAVTGEVTIVGGGSTVITAQIAETAEYAAAEVSYTLTVYDVIDRALIGVSSPVKYAEPQAAIPAGIGYGAADITWSVVNGNVFTGDKFDANTSYKAAATLTALSGYKFDNGEDTYEFSKQFNATEDVDVLGGTVTIEGNAVYGNELTAKTDGLNFGDEAFLGAQLSYQWFRGSETTPIGAGKTYTLDAADIGQTIKVVVSNAHNRGSVTSAATETVQKAACTTPAAAPAVSAKDAKSITVTVVDGQQYAIYPASETAPVYSWQDSGEFTRLTQNTEYVIVTRVKETPTHFAGTEVTVQVTTDKLIEGADPAVTAPVKYKAPQSSIEATDAYTGTISWSPEVQNNMFAGDTAYTATVVLTAKDGYWFAEGKTLTIVKNFGKTAGVDTLGGTVTISGDAVYGETLEAVTSGLNYGAEAVFTPQLSYQWYRGSEMISDASESTYKLVKEDIGKTIKVEVSNAYNNGSVFSDATDAVAKKAGAAAAVPADFTVTAETITVNDTKAGQLYSADGWATFQRAEADEQAVVFENLAPETQYQIFTKVAETDVALEGTSSEGVQVVTEKLIPAVNTDTSVEVPVKYGIPQKEVSGTGYTGTVAWSPEVGEKFAGSTVYTATVTLTAVDGYWFDDAIAGIEVSNGGKTAVFSKTFEETVGAYDLLGSVTISGEAVYGKTLTAVPALNYNGEQEGTISYQWYRDGEPITDAEEATYTLSVEDVDAYIAVRVKNSYNNGFVEAVDYGPVEKAAGKDAVAAELTVTADTITVANVKEDQEYAIAEGGADAGAWTSGAEIVFTGLKADTEYVVSTRAKETPAYYAGAVTRTAATTDKLIYSVAYGDITPAKYGTPETAVAETDGYKAGTITWSPAAAEKFAAGTVYTATVTVEAKAGYRFDKTLAGGEVTISEDAKVYTYVHTFPVTAPLDTLEGTVAVTGNAVYGQVLTADTENLIYGVETKGTLTYQWYRGTEVISGAEAETYELVKEDIGKTISVEVKNSNNLGSVKSAATEAVVKMAGAEAVKAEVSVTADTITVSNVTAGQEYSIDGATWQTSGVFSGLEADAAYTVYTRKAETDVAFAGAEKTTDTRTLKLEQILTATQATVSVKFGKTLNLNTIVSSNAAGAALVYTTEGTVPAGTAFADGVITAGTEVGEFTVKVNAAAVGKYYAAEEITLTVKITEKDAQVFKTGFTAGIVKSYGDARFGRTAELQTGNGAITYTSSNEAVATVDTTGGVTIVGVGETVITATAAETADFAEASVSYTLTVNKKALTVPTVSGTYAYTGAEQTVTLAGFDAEIMEVSGNTGTNAGTYTAVVTLKDTANYKWTDETTEAKSIEWTIAKAKVTGTPAFTKINAAGKTLADAPISAGTITVEGTVAWDDAADTKVTANKEYGWTFTPADTDNYEVLTGKAVVYTYYAPAPSIPVKPQVQTPEITPDSGASDVTLSEDGTKATVELKDGYKVVDVLVNGQSIGAVTELENLKTGDVVEIMTEPIVIDELEAVVLDADSKAVTMKSGKKAIKLTWKCNNGTDMEYDGYEIFRSTKRYSGFGKKPFFVTTRNVYYNTNVKPGVKYYYKVRAFVEFEGKKYYTDWSLKAWRTL